MADSDVVNLDLIDDLVPKSPERYVVTKINIFIKSVHFDKKRA